MHLIERTSEATVAVDPRNHLPIYEQIVEEVCASLAAGVYRAGDMLPSIRAMAVEMLVNPNTVQRACQVLERMGLIETRRGLGMFVTENGHSAARQRSETSVRSRFAEGIRIGKSASVGQDAIRTIFDKTLHAFEDAEPPPPKSGPSEPTSEAHSSRSGLTGDQSASKPPKDPPTVTTSEDES